MYRVCKYSVYMCIYIHTQGRGVRSVHLHNHRGTANRDAWNGTPNGRRGSSSATNCAPGRTILVLENQMEAATVITNWWFNG